MIPIKSKKTYSLLPAVNAHPKIGHTIKQISQEDTRFQNAQISPKKNNWNFEGLKLSQRQYCTHFFHHYTAKFIPQIPQNIIKQFRKPGDIVFDPFLGSGTTIVEGKLANHVSAGIEVNPMGFKVAKAKVTPIDFGKVSEFLEWIKQKQETPEHAYAVDLFEDSTQWFRADVRFKINNILNKIKKYDANTKNFIEVGLSDHLKGLSNAMMHRTIPTLPKKERYIDKKHYDRPVNNKTRDIDVYGRVGSQIKRMQAALKYLLDKNKTQAIPIQGDSRNLISHLNEKKIEEVNIVVTSPPYWSAQNYQELHNLSMKLFGLTFPKLNEIGRSKKAYLQDMECVINQLAQITKGTLAFVIGEDKTEDKHHQQLFDMICSEDFTPIRKIKREISQQAGFTKQISYEHIYIFNKK